jgi:hypothetical protein
VNGQQNTYFVTVLFLRSSSDEPVCHGDFCVVPRKWEVGTSDWALLEAEHNLKVEYQMADVFTGGCNMEIAVTAEDRQAAGRKFDALRFVLGMAGANPILAPFISTHSMNDFSAIKQASQDPQDPRHARARALASKDEEVEVWWHQPALSMNSLKSPRIQALGSDELKAAAEAAHAWLEISSSDPLAATIEDTARAAPTVENIGQSILLIWTGIESLFPTVHSELSFRLAMYLAQMQAPLGTDRLAYYERAKNAYNVRSKVAHGSPPAKTFEDVRAAWDDAWGLLMDVGSAVISRGGLPTEAKLMAELLQ